MQKTLNINDTDYEFDNIRFYDKDLVITTWDQKILEFPQVSRVKVEHRTFGGDDLLMEVTDTMAYSDGIRTRFIIRGVTFR